MLLTSRIVLAAAAGLVCLIPTVAVAQPANPCGKFDFSSGLSCRIEVEGGCQAQCTPLSFKGGCTGGCTATATQSCVGSCGAQCVAECNPQLLDCFAGCHAECDEPQTAQCQEKQPGADCVAIAKAQCDMHCETACEVPPSSCQEHCTSCCTGGCTTQANFDCDFQCFAELEGGCNVQCQAPTGALFCNGQYVFASDVEGCIAHLATQGIQVDTSARVEVTCDFDGCDGAGEASGPFGCATVARVNAPLWGALGLVAGAMGLAARRRRRN